MPFLTVDGHCGICDRDVTFVSESSWLRDHFVCPSCHSIPRERALLACLERYAPDWPTQQVYEAAPCGRGLSNRIARDAHVYVSSQYFPDRAAGARGPTGERNEDLEKLTFADASFDLVVTQDVLEHVLDPTKAFAEIARVLRPGGLHVFTTPLVNRSRPSTCRARRECDGGVRLLGPAVYHQGNPADPQGALVTWDWGYDIVHLVYEASRMPTAVVVIDDLLRGIRAEYIEVLVSAKLPGAVGGEPPSPQGTAS
jgi:SAM-dependent methyltransferase